MCGNYERTSKDNESTAPFFGRPGGVLTSGYWHETAGKSYAVCVCVWVGGRVRGKCVCVCVYVCVCVSNFYIFALASFFCLWYLSFSLSPAILSTLCLSLYLPISPFNHPTLSSSLLHSLSPTHLNHLLLYPSLPLQLKSLADVAGSATFAGGLSTLPRYMGK